MTTERERRPMTAKQPREDLWVRCRQVGQNAAIICAVTVLPALLPLPVAAQVGAWQLDGTVRTRGFEKDGFELGAVLGIFADGTYVADGSLICGGACELGTWTRKGNKIRLTPTNGDDSALGVTRCLFGNGFIRTPNAKLRTYSHVIKAKPDGTLTVKSKAKARARFVYGWRSVRATGTAVATPTTEARLDRWLEGCFF